MEKRGTPTFAIVTTGFTRLAMTTAKSSGMSALRIVEVPHPIGGIAAQEVHAKASLAVDEILRKKQLHEQQVHEQQVHEQQVHEQQVHEQQLHEQQVHEHQLHGRGEGEPGDDPQTGARGMVTVTGSGAAVTSAYYKNGWTDGLPIVPPTAEAVREMLAGTDLAPSHVLGRMVPKNALATVEKLAINAVMAGCRPTYLPVLIAAVEAMLETDFDLAGVQCSTGPHSPLLLINGPVRDQINVNYSSGALGHGWQANATIGRAVRLVLNNIGGAKIGESDMTTLGMAENYTYCFGENEERNPWGPLHVEQGFGSDDSTVSVLGAYAPENVSDHVGIKPEEILAVAADVMTKLTRFHLLAMDHVISRDTLLVLGPEHAKSIADAGWSKAEVRRFVFEHASIPYDTLRSLRRQIDASLLIDAPGGKRVPMFARPECLKIVVAGGAGKHSAYINSGHSKRLITRKIVFPREWRALVERYRE